MFTRLKNYKILLSFVKTLLFLNYYKESYHPSKCFQTCRQMRHLRTGSLGTNEAN